MAKHSIGTIAARRSTSKDGVSPPSACTLEVKVQGGEFPIHFHATDVSGTGSLVAALSTDEALKLVEILRAAVAFLESAGGE